MNREIALEDGGTMTQAAKRKSEEEGIATVELSLEPHFEVCAMSADDDFFRKHPNTAFAIFFGATATILLALMLVLWVSQQVR